MSTYYVSGIKKLKSGAIGQLLVALLDPSRSHLGTWTWVTTPTVMTAICAGHEYFTATANAQGLWVQGALLQLHLTTHPDHSTADNLRSLPVHP